MYKAKILFILFSMGLFCSLLTASGIEIGTGMFDRVKYSNYILEERFEGITNSLRIISDVLENEGELVWEKAKPLLSKIENQYRGLSLLILPNGDYYSGTRNYTGLNLRSREYYDDIMSGNEILGFPVFSKSTGKKSLVFAIPVFIDGKVAGAVGFTCYLDTLNSWIMERAIIPQACEFYVLDSNGKILMSNDYSYLYEDMDFLVKGVNDEMEIFRGANGFYAFVDENGERIVAYSVSDKFGLISVIVLKESSDACADYFMLKIQRQIGDILIDLDWQLENASSHIDEYSTEEDIVEILMKLQNHSEYVVDTSFIDDEGYMKYVVPSEYSEYEGKYIGNQEQILKLKSEKYPVMSGIFYSVEGFDAIDMEWPVFSTNGELIGSLSYLIRPGIFLSDIFSSLDENEYELWMLDANGTIVYDRDEYEIGKNLFEDGIYSEFEELVNLGKIMVEQRYGKGKYRFYLEGTDKIACKNVIWTTVGLHGTQFRLLLGKKSD